jgi:hypothetical protein
MEAAYVYEPRAVSEGASNWGKMLVVPVSRYLVLLVGVGSDMPGPLL